MGLTGIIYAGIVVLWLCYLVPLALRRHDEVSRRRSVDRFSAAMRVLGRNDPVGRSRPAEPLLRTRSLRATGVAVPEVAAAGPGASPAASPGASRRAARLAAARRRRVLGVLVLLAGCAGAAAFLGLIPVWSMSVPGAVVLAFLVIARVQVRRARATSWENALRTAAATTAATPVGPVGNEPDESPTVELAAVLGEQAATPAISTEDGPSLWDPLPVTLPTYVTKPRAERSIRTVDLTGDGAWTSGRLPEPEGDEALVGAATVEGDAARQAVGD